VKQEFIKTFSRLRPALLSLGTALYIFANPAAAADEVVKPKEIQKELQPAAGFSWVGQHTDGRLEIFVRGNQGLIWHNLQNLEKGTWEGWKILSGAMTDFPTVARNTDGRFELVGIKASTLRLQHNWQMPSRTEWSGWHDLGDQLFEGRPAVVQNADGRLEAFVRARDGSIRHTWQDTAAKGWSVWLSLGGSMDGNPIATRNRDGQVDVFAIEANTGHLQRTWRKLDGSWSGWNDFGEMRIDLSPSVGVNADGGLEIFVVSHDSSVWWNHQNKDGTWDGWVSLGGSVKSSIAVARNQDGRMEIFAVGYTSSQLEHCFQMPGDRHWAGWSSLGEIEFSNDICTVSDRSGRIQVFGYGLDGNIWQILQIAPNAPWTPFTSLGGPWKKNVPQYTARNWQTDDGLPNNAVQAIQQTRDGYLWVGTRQGLARFDGLRFAVMDQTPELVRCSVTALFESRDGALWVGTDKGLIQLKDGRFSHYTRRDGLTSDSIRALCETRDGSLWIGTMEGITRFRAGKFSAVDEATFRNRAIRSLFEDKEGFLWASAGGGLYRLKDGAVVASSSHTLLKTSVRAISQDQRGQFWIGTDDGLGNLSMEAASTNLQFGAFYDKSDGLGDNFVTTLQEDRLGNLWIGSYGGLNRFSGSGKNLFSIGARFATKRRMELKLERLEHQNLIEKERTRIARDMHDDLGARLTEILLLSDRVEKCETAEDSRATGTAISNVTREVASSLNAIVWAVTPKNDSLDGLAAYISDYAVKYLGRSSIECQIDMPDDFPAWLGSSETRHDLFLIVKEALNNVAKHSGASEVRLGLKIEKSILHLSIQDNGRGLERTEKPSLGNGLSNMEKRAAKNGGSCTIENHAGKGVSIEVKIPLSSGQK